MSACFAEAHSLSEGHHTLDREKCTVCGRCTDVCLGDALSFYGKEMTVEELLPLLLEDKEFYKNSCGGVTLSGGECLMQADFCAELSKRLKAEGIHIAVDTCGFVSKEALDKVIPYTDVFLYDIKAYDENVHIKCTGRSNTQILENLKYLDSLGKNIEIRIPYVPEYNADQIDKIAHFLSNIKHITKLRVLPYHSYAGSKYLALHKTNSLPSTLPTDTELENARQLIKSITNIVATF